MFNVFLFNDTASTEIYTYGHTLSLHDALPICTEIPDVTLPPELDRVLRDYERAWRAGDAAALASLFTEDGFILQSNRPPIRGRSAIQATYEDQGEGGPLRLRALAFTTADTIGYIIGAYSYDNRSEEHTSELQSLMRISYAVFCLKNKKT